MRAVPIQASRTFSTTEFSAFGLHPLYHTGCGEGEFCWLSNIRCTTEIWHSERKIAFWIERNSRMKHLLETENWNGCSRISAFYEVFYEIKEIFVYLLIYFFRKHFPRSLSKTVFTAFPIQLYFAWSQRGQYQALVCVSEVASTVRAVTDTLREEVHNICLVNVIMRKISQV